MCLLSPRGSEGFQEEVEQEGFSGLWPVQQQQEMRNDRIGNNADEGQSWMTIGPRIRKLG